MSATPEFGLHLHLFGQMQRIVGVSPEVAYRAFNLGVPEQQLDRSSRRPASRTRLEHAGFVAVGSLQALAQRTLPTLLPSPPSISTSTCLQSLVNRLAMATRPSFLSHKPVKCVSSPAKAQFEYVDSPNQPQDVRLQRIPSASTCLTPRRGNTIVHRHTIHPLPAT